MGYKADSLAIDSVLRQVHDAFKKHITDEIRKRVHAEVGPMLEEVVQAEAGRITKSLVSYYEDPMRMAAVLEYRLTINGEVKHDGNP